MSEKPQMAWCDPSDSLPDLAEHHRHVSEALAERLRQLEAVLQNEVAATFGIQALFSDDGD